jgi:hypothetical protein
MSIDIYLLLFADRIRDKFKVSDDKALEVAEKVINGPRPTVDSIAKMMTSAKRIIDYN